MFKSDKINKGGININDIEYTKKAFTANRPMCVDNKTIIIKIDKSNACTLRRVLIQTGDLEPPWEVLSDERKDNRTMIYNVLNQIGGQESNDQVDKLESMNDRMNKLESNVRFMRGKDFVDTLTRIDKLESLIGDLTTVMNKHSTCGGDYK